MCVREDGGECRRERIGRRWERREKRREVEKKKLEKRRVDEEIIYSGEGKLSLSIGHSRFRCT